MDNPKQLFWFNVSGAIGTALFQLCYQGLAVVSEPWAWHPTFLYFLSYFLSIIWQHWLHRRLVFGTEGPYWRSLFMTYVAYSLSIAISTAGNGALVEYVGMHHQVAMVVTLLGTGLFNYFTLNNAFQPEGAKAGEATSPGAGKKVAKD